MNQRITRRRFGQLALASAATAAIANLGTKAVAQQSSDTLFGIRLSSGISSAPPFNNTRADITSVANTTPEIVLISSNLATGSTIATLEIPATTVSNQDLPINRTPTTAEFIERLTSLTSQPNGILVSTIVSSAGNSSVTKLVFTSPNSSQPLDSVRLSGFPTNNSTVESLVVTRGNNFIGLISTNGSTLPFELAKIDRTTGNVILGANSNLPRLDPTQGYGTLAQSPDGTIYIVTIARDGRATLAQVNVRSGINRVVQLSFKNKPLGNGLLSLAVSSSGQLYGLANPNYEEINSLFTINPRSGVLTLVRPFDADQITITPG